MSKINKLNKLNRDEFFSINDLKGREWTEVGIKKFLLKPDATKQNPVYKSRPPMRLWLKKRVCGVEQTKEFQSWLEKSRKRKKISKNVVENKKQKLIKEVKEWDPKLRVPKHNVVKKAISHYNDWKCYNGHYESVLEKDVYKIENIDFLKRIVGNYLRHQCSDYDHMLLKIKGKVGVGKAYVEIKSMISERMEKEINNAIKSIKLHNER